MAEQEQPYVIELCRNWLYRLSAVYQGDKTFFRNIAFFSKHFSEFVGLPRRGLPLLRQMASYYDVDEIITDDEVTSVNFLVGAHGVGLLDPSSETNNVEKGAKVDLPFWLAHELFLRQAATINFPACFNQKTRKEIQADASCVDLRIRCPYFYEFGCKIIPVTNDKTLGSFLQHAFTNRYKEILSKSHSAGTSPKFSTRLTKEESQLFEAARCSMLDFKKWRTSGCKLERASILARKRKATFPELSSSS